MVSSPAVKIGIPGRIRNLPSFLPLQLFQVAYVTITMANSPRPGVWTLERSMDHGNTWQPWQHFAGNDAECQKYFNMHANERIRADDQAGH